MPAFLTSAGIIAAAFEWGIGRIGELGLDGLKARLGERGAKQELAEIAARSVDEAALAAPGLADLLCSEAYVNNVLAVGILDILRDPGGGMDPKQLARRFIERFVTPYVERTDVDATLRHVFKTEAAQLQIAFEHLVNALRRELATSKHWRDPIAVIVAEETRLGVLAANRKLDALVPAEPSLKGLRADAKIGSDQLRAWPTKIQGLYLDRPERGQLLDRVRTHPGAATLVIGPSGSGKSALFADLTRDLEEAGMTVFAIKADKLSEKVRTLAELSHELGMTGEIDKEIETLARHEPVVVMIDQLDAVSEVMDRGSERMNLLLRLANRWRVESGVSTSPVHVIVSSRPFEARHDARFRSLKAEEVSLTLPPYERIEALLQDLGITGQRVPAGLKETLRRPFMLKLFVEIVQRNEPVEGLVDGELLTAWLTSAQIGHAAERREVLELLQALAREMTETETLWRPADRYARDHPEALRRAEACELILRKEGRIGFTHQAWLDDFQAKRFLTGDALAEYAWNGQESLFGRATVLRCLERFRSLDQDAYGRALDLLLGETKTRRHLRHLAVEFLSGQPAPLPQEIRWVQRLIQQDPPLARVGLSRIVDHWVTWRAALTAVIPALAREESLKWTAVAMATAEARIEPEAGEALVHRLWGDADGDLIAFDVFHRAALWSPIVKARVREILARVPLREAMIAHFISELEQAKKPKSAVELLELYLHLHGTTLKLPASFHGLERVAKAVPVEFATVVLSWFVTFASTDFSDRNGIHDVFPLVRTIAFRLARA